MNGNQWVLISPIKKYGSNFNPKSRKREGLKMSTAELIYVLSLAFGIASIFVLLSQIRPQNKWLMICLSGYLFILGTSNLMVVFFGTGIMLKVPWLYKVLMPFSLLAPVLGFWYIKGTLGQIDRLRPLDYMHLVLFVLVLAHYLPFYVMPLDEKQQLVSDVMANNTAIVSVKNGWIFSEGQIYVIRSVQAVYYVVFSWMAIRRFERDWSIINSDKHINTVLKWLRFFVKTKASYLLSIFLCYLLLALQFSNVAINEVIAQALFVLTAALVFLLSSYLLIHPKSLRSIEKPISVTREMASSHTLMPEVLEQMRNEQLYADPKLTQPLVLERFELKLSEFSLFIKSQGYEHFNDLINSMRLEAFIDRATTEEVERSSIEGIANACGFRSSSTFYRVFKEKYNCTPRQFLENR